MRKSILFVFCLYSSFSIGQLKVDDVGHVGIGTLWPNPGYKCHIAGHLLLSNYPAVPTYEFQFKVGNGWPGAQIAASGDIIAFWDSYVGYHQLYASNYLVASDRQLKSNIKPIEAGIEHLMMLEPMHYSIVDNRYDPNTNKKIEGSRPEYGFIAQDVKEILPDVAITTIDDSIMLMDYRQIIPLAVKAIQEQQYVIDSLNARLNSLSSRINNMETNLDNNDVNGSSYLEQNAPNPFDEKTIIRYSISDINFQSASLIIFDMNGALQKKYVINNAGNGEVTIHASDLKPGMYMYTLIINRKEIDTKRMILLD